SVFARELATARSPVLRSERTRRVTALKASESRSSGRGWVLAGSKGRGGEKRGREGAADAGRAAKRELGLDSGRGVCAWRMAGGGGRRGWGGGARWSGIWGRWVGGRRVCSGKGRVSYMRPAMISEKVTTDFSSRWRSNAAMNTKTTLVMLASSLMVMSALGI